MANFVFNIAKGKSGQYFQNVEDNSPAGCAIVVVPIEASGVETSFGRTDDRSATIVCVER